MTTLSGIEKFFRLQSMNKAGSAESCPTCGRGNLQFVSSEREPIMGELGPQIDTMRCDNPRCAAGHTRIHAN